jgi:hypothetical protein
VTTEVPISELSALVRKYGAITELRRGLGVRDDSKLRDLATEFPGALRELDALTLAELDERLAATQRARNGAPVAPWISAMLAYHAVMKRALAVKALLGGVRSPKPPQVEAIRARLQLDFGVACSSEFVTKVASPPGGRLNALVLELVATPEFGALALERLLFGRTTAGSRAAPSSALERSVTDP